VGERVVVHSRWGCGHCRFCLQGMDNVCQTPVGELGFHGGGAGRDGGLTKLMVVPSSRYLVPIGDLDAAQAAPLADAALTSYHAITMHRDKLLPHTTAVVIGVGGLGHVAVQLLRALSPVRIVAADVKPEALEVARAAGAHEVLDAGALTLEGLREAVGGVGAGIVLDFVATGQTLALSAGVAAQGGAIVYVGRGGGTLPVKAFDVPFDTSITVPTWGTIPELSEVVALARSGQIHMETQPYALSAAVDAYGDLHHGRVVGRAVVAP
jgi:alcohol dehydrogenase, propanol-preferring